jgi:maltooligosyltrehalose synthase
MFRYKNSDPISFLGKSFYVLVEKILEKGEELPNDWAVDGTTGYDFMNMLNGVFVATKHYDVSFAKKIFFFRQ